MADLYKHRSNEIELMDDLDSGGHVIEQTLRELENINLLLGGNKVTINAIKKLIDPKIKKPWKILDLGCGGGDMLMRIARWARKAKVTLELVGIDANPQIIAYAENQCKAYPEITFQSVNIFSDDFKSMGCDIITSTLFTHHFTDEQLISLFKQFKKQARVGLAINDLHRHWFAYRSVNILTSLFSKSVMVKNDAGVSVLRSFKKNEWEHILKASGIANYTIEWFWAFRWQVVVRW